MSITYYTKEDVEIAVNNGVRMALHQAASSIGKITEKSSDNAIAIITDMLTNAYPEVSHVS